MALNAYHINDDDPFDHVASGRAPPRLRDATPPATQRRPGLGHARHDASQNDWAWSTLSTGESTAAAAQRMRTWFVGATALSDPSLRNAPASVTDAAAALVHDPVPAPVTPVSPQLETMSQLYAALTRDLETPDSATATAPPAPATTRRPPPRAAPVAAPHAARVKAASRQQSSDWFVSKALARLQQQKASAAQASAIAQSTGDNGDSDGDRHASTSPTRQTCPCPGCGEPIPLNASPSDLALHRQSIAHRLGLNAPVSSASASASEAATPVVSCAETPLDRSRSPSRAVSPAHDTGGDGQVGSENKDDSQAAASARNHRGISSRWRKLRSDNVGYSLLARMGWKEGMGLGIEEWKWQQLAKAKRRQAAEAALKQRRASSATRAEPGVGVVDSIPSDGQSASRAIVVLSSDDDEGRCDAIDVDMDSPREQQEVHQPGGTSQLGRVDWWDNLPRASGVADDGYQFGDDADHVFDGPSSPPPLSPSALADGDSIDMSARPSTMTAPIDIDLKTDRRGLGMRPRGTRRSRTAEGEVEIRRRAYGDDDDEGQPARQRSRTRSGGEPSRKGDRPDGSQRMTKARRKRDEARRKAEWLAVRASLS
ncbi:uncharacterized protein PFL1_05838 [Pseudozyma flocculosa PF-1]|uniref:G-patch domain-containing protein n=2 Tax=Pseudozyma flocculosa TaxID=84751 RepID=A0A5C3F3E6_9BASI|nr:uncharacterized protein PFL1_05838 [Pseudozyma flocculosa PF-1]EPQ26516.1 hypothetical protein PFL1_05838 [Pseudozyma flocculosa PF-1]SPO38495.1 uncharacterized protein PSFLO_03973 [Pseudozyma flocculosa]